MAILIVLPLALVAFAGCVVEDDDTDTRAALGPGTLQAFVKGTSSASAESEAESTIESMEAKITRVEAKASSEASADADVEGDAGSEATATSTATSTVVIVDEATTVEVPSDADSEAFVGEAEVDAAVFDEVTFVIEELVIVPENGDEFVIVLEDFTITVHGNFIVKADETTQVLVELGLGDAIVRSGALERASGDAEADADADADTDADDEHQTDDEGRVVINNIDIHIEVHQTLVATSTSTTNVVINDFDDDNAQPADSEELDAEAKAHSEALAEARAESEAEADADTEAEHDAGDKVLVCHRPPGNETNEQTIEVGGPGAEAHVEQHNDTHGMCPGDEESDAIPESALPEDERIVVNATAESEATAEADADDNTTATETTTAEAT